MDSEESEIGTWDCGIMLISGPTLPSTLSWAFFLLDKGTTGSSEFDTHRTAFWEMGNAINNLLLLCSSYDSGPYFTEQIIVIVQKNLQSKYKPKHNKEKNKIKGVVHALRYICKHQIK